MNQEEIETLNLFGHNLAYHRNGQGKPILLVHGITTYSFIWRKMIPLLKDDYEIIALDLLGCGDSDKPLNVDYSIKHQTNRIN